MADRELNHSCSHSSREHIDHLATYWAEVFGGPRRYAGSLGGHSGMLAIHAGQGASEDLSTRFVACFMQAADYARLPDDPEFRPASRSVIQPSVREAASCLASASL